MSGWNRLAGDLREELAKLPVWTTDEDRRRALSYEDSSLLGARGALTAVHTGQEAPSNLGEIIAVARYEDAGWMPDGGFDRWRRWIFGGAGSTEQLTTGALIQWLGFVESDMQKKLQDLETRLVIQCRVEDEKLAGAQAAAERAYRHLHKHRQTQVLARLSTGDAAGAREIAYREPFRSTQIMDMTDNRIQTMALRQED